jgi:hypothetical protein
MTTSEKAKVAIGPTTVKMLGAGELKEKSLKELQSIYEGLTGRTIKKFSDKETAVKRILGVGSPAEMIWCLQKGGRLVPRAGCETRQANPKMSKDCVVTCEYRNKKKEPEGKAEKKEKKGSRANSKVARLRRMFLENGTQSLADVIRDSGFDHRNVFTAVAILRNPKRTKDLLDLGYDRKTQIFTKKG